MLFINNTSKTGKQKRLKVKGWKKLIHQYQHQIWRIKKKSIIRVLEDTENNRKLKSIIKYKKPKLCMSNNMASTMYNQKKSEELQGRKMKQQL